MGNKKVIAVIIGILLAVCLIFGIIGLLESKKTPRVKPEVKYQVTYKYYLNDVEVAQMPTNPKMIVDEGSSVASTKEADVEKLYAFNTATCTNNVTYTWNEDTWTFTPSNTADSTCSLYFVTTYNTFKLEVKNAKIEGESEMKVKRGEDAVIKITPDEGYIFEKAECTNNEVAEWDNDAKELIVRSITLETSCKANFVIGKFTVETQVNLGTGTTKVEYEYGKKIELKVTPAEGYGNPDITCTNDQKATWKDNTLTIDKLTNSTVCTITFKKLQTKVDYTVSLDVGTLGTILSGTNPAKVTAGGSVSWNIRVSEGYIINENPTCSTGTPSVTTSGNDYIITLKDVDKDGDCSIIYKQQTQTQQPTE